MLLHQGKAQLMALQICNVVLIFFTFSARAYLPNSVALTFTSPKTNCHYYHQ